MEKQAPPPYAPPQDYPPSQQGYPPPQQGYPPPQQGYPPPQQGYPPPQQGYPPPQQGYAQPQQPGQTVVVTQPATVVAVGGNCPNCRVGMLQEEFTCCGIVLAILFFPLGILCCLLMKEKRCSSCGRSF